MITIKDIAKEVNLSHSVVSRALNPNPDKNARISQNTKRLVKEKAREMGYQPNRIAEFMRRGRSAAIGVFLPDYSNRLISDLVIGISESANKYGFPLNFYFGLNYESYASFINKNIKNPSSGIISYPYEIEANSRIDSLFKTYLSAGGNGILLNTTRQQTVPVLYMHEEHGSRCAAKCLLKRDCYQYFAAEGFSERIVPFTDYMKEKGERCRTFKIDKIVEIIKQLEGQNGSSAGIFATTDKIALLIMKEINNSTLKIGKDIFIVGYDDLELTALIDPPLTTVHQPFKIQGIRAVEKLINMLYGNKEENEAVIPYLVKRDTA